MDMMSREEFWEMKGWGHPDDIFTEISEGFEEIYERIRLLKDEIKNLNSLKDKQ